MQEASQCRSSIYKMGQLGGSNLPWRYNHLKELIVNSWKSLKTFGLNFLLKVQTDKKIFKPKRVLKKCSKWLKICPSMHASSVNSKQTVECDQDYTKCLLQYLISFNPPIIVNPTGIFVFFLQNCSA